MTTARTPRIVYNVMATKHGQLRLYISVGKHSRYTFATEPVDNIFAFADKGILIVNAFIAGMGEADEIRTSKNVKVTIDDELTMNLTYDPTIDTYGHYEANRGKIVTVYEI